jgi:hypothetical protein
LNQLINDYSLDEVTNILTEEFSNSLGRPLEPGTLTDEELETAKEMEKELVSEEFLLLHSERGEPDSLRKLKISARAFIHADEMNLDGHNLQGSFMVSQGIIQEVILESNPENDWSFMEENLRGVPFVQWKEQVLVR